VKIKSKSIFKLKIFPFQYPIRLLSIPCLFCLLLAWHIRNKNHKKCAFISHHFFVLFPFLLSKEQQWQNLCSFLSQDYEKIVAFLKNERWTNPFLCSFNFTKFYWQLSMCLILGMIFPDFIKWKNWFVCSKILKTKYLPLFSDRGTSPLGHAPVPSVY